MSPVLLAALLVLVVVVTVSGAVVTIADPATLPFKMYVEDVIQLAAALGLTAAIGAGALALKKANHE
jgi:hypothetical protein